MSSLRSRASFAAAAAVMLLVAAGCARNKSAAPGVQPERKDASTVKGADIEDHPDAPIEQLLAGKVAGVLVGRAPDGTLTVRIRGATSGYNAEPLYVVDGVAVQAGPSGALAGINPRDIESIKVLKGPTETAMYGARGANGVIVIKTKAK